MKTKQIGFFILMLFCFFRPLALIDINVEIGGLNVFELFAIIISYMLLFDIAINIKALKYDIISMSILYFCFYCFMSILWGSQLRTVAQVTLPFILFFSARIILSKSKETKILVAVFIIVCCIPLVLSLFQTIQGTSVIKIESITGIERHVGVFKNLKSFSYTMFFFSVFFYMQAIIFQIKPRILKYILFIVLLISFFCIFKTYVRTTYIGLSLFWIISMWGYNKKYFSFVLILSIIIGFIYITPLQQIFFKSQEFNINVASSGRDYLWGHNIRIFLESDIIRQLFGHGLGISFYVNKGSSFTILPSHNDYIQVLLSLGSVGLLLYLLIFLVLLKDIYTSKVSKKIKIFYYGIIFSILTMNFASGAILLRVGISQLFWMVIGYFYVFQDFAETSDFSDRLEEKTEGLI